MSKFSRASFLKSAGIATGAVVVGGVPAVAEAAADGAPQIVLNPSTLPHEPLVAYVRNAERGEVTIVSGLHETTFKDKTLVKRIAKAAQKHAAHGKAVARKNRGVI
jgi:hypothetical protein